MAFSKMNGNSLRASEFHTWEVEVSELYRNYMLIGLILNQSARLSDDARVGFRLLRNELAISLGRFINDLDEPGTNLFTKQKAIFSNHIGTMQQLNKSTADLVKQYALSDYQTMA